MRIGKLISIKILVISCMLLFCFSCSKPLPVFEGINAENYNLKDINGDSATVLVFLAPSCPLSENYTVVLNKLNSEYSSKGIKFFGIISGNLSTKLEAKVFSEKYSINFPILLDTSYFFSKKWKAKITPEVLFISSKNKVLYRGAIDNWAIELTKMRSNSTADYLKDALGSFQRHEKIKIKESEPIGCYIE